MRENQKYMEGLEAKAKLLKAQFDLLVNGDGGFNSFLKTLLDIGTAILKFANSDVGGAILQIGALVMASVLLTNALMAMSTSIKVAGTTSALMATGLTAMEVEEAIATGATLTLGGAIKALTASMLTNPLFLGAMAVVGGIYAIVKAVDYFNVTLEESQDKLYELQDAYNSATNDVSSIETSLKSVSDKIKEINDLDGAKVVKDGELETLEKQEASLQRQLDIAKETQRIAGQKAEEQAVKTLSTKVEYVGTRDSVTSSDQPVPEDITRQEALIRTVSDLEALQRTYDNTAESMAKLSSENKMGSQEYKDLSEKARITKDQLDVLTTSANDQALALEEEGKSLIGTTNESKALALANENALNVYDKFIGILDDAVSSEEADAEAKKLAEENATASAEAQEEANQALEDSVSQISSIADNYSTLSSAVDEYNSSGALSFETLDKLMSLGGDYLSLLTMENGQLTLNKEGFNALANAKIDTAEMTAYNKAMTDLEAISIQDAGNASAEASGKIISAGDSAYISGVNALNSVGKWNSFWGAILNEKGVKADNEQGKKIGSSLKAQLTALEGARKSIGKYASATGKSAKATGGATKATKSHTDALKEQQKALQDTVDKYEKVIAYINSKVDDQIDKLKDLKDTALDAIDAQITALEDQRDAEEDLWNDKIDALNAQNDALEDQIKLEQLLQALALAQSKKVRIFREGKGFVYESDQSAVSEAQKDLAEYNRQAKLKAQVKELELARDAMLAVYNKQISDLEAYKKSVEASYDAQIKYYEDWKDKFKEQTDAFEDEQNRLLALQLTGIDFENQNWTTRLGNLSNFVNQYRAYQQQLADLTAQINASAESAGDDGGSGSSGGGGGGGSTVATPTAKKVNGYQGKVKYTGKYPVSYNGSTYRRGQTATFKGASPQDVASQIASFIRACGKSYANQIGGITAYAKGVASVTGDQMAITGEGANRELVLGSKANGTLTKLDKGAGVVNAKSLKTFAGILNTIGASGMTGRTSSQISNTSNSNSQVVNISNITLPEVKDPQGFTNWLSDFNNNMTRRSYSNA